MLGEADVQEAAVNLREALSVEYVVLGGGNAKQLRKLPDGWVAIT